MCLTVCNEHACEHSKVILKAACSFKKSHGSAAGRMLSSMPIAGAIAEPAACSPQSHTNYLHTLCPSCDFAAKQERVPDHRLEQDRRTNRHAMEVLAKQDRERRAAREARKRGDFAEGESNSIACRVADTLLEKADNLKDMVNAAGERIRRASFDYSSAAKADEGHGNKWDKVKGKWMEGRDDWRPASSVGWNGSNTTGSSSSNTPTREARVAVQEYDGLAYPEMPSSGTAYLVPSSQHQQQQQQRHQDEETRRLRRRSKSFTGPSSSTQYFASFGGACTGVATTAAASAETRDMTTSNMTRTSPELYCNNNAITNTTTNTARQPVVRRPETRSMVQPYGAAWSAPLPPSRSNTMEGGRLISSSSMGGDSARNGYNDGVYDTPDNVVRAETSHISKHSSSASSGTSRSWEDVDFVPYKPGYEALINGAGDARWSSAAPEAYLERLAGMHGAVRGPNKLRKVSPQHDMRFLVPSTSELCLKSESPVSRADAPLTLLAGTIVRPSTTPPRITTTTNPSTGLGRERSPLGGVRRRADAPPPTRVQLAAVSSKTPSSTPAPPRRPRSRSPTRSTQASRARSRSRPAVAAAAATKPAPTPSAPRPRSRSPFPSAAAVARPNTPANSSHKSSGRDGATEKPKFPPRGARLRSDEVHRLFLDKDHARLFIAARGEELRQRDEDERAARDALRAERMRAREAQRVQRLRPDGPAAATRQPPMPLIPPPPPSDVSSWTDVSVHTASSTPPPAASNIRRHGKNFFPAWSAGSSSTAGKLVAPGLNVPAASASYEALIEEGVADGQQQPRQQSPPRTGTGLSSHSSSRPGSARMSRQTSSVYSTLTGTSRNSSSGRSFYRDFYPDMLTAMPPPSRPALVPSIACGFSADDDRDFLPSRSSTFSTTASSSPSPSSSLSYSSSSSSSASSNNSCGVQRNLSTMVRVGTALEEEDEEEEKEDGGDGYLTSEQAISLWWSPDSVGAAVRDPVARSASANACSLARSNARSLRGRRQRGGRGSGRPT